MRRVDCAGNEGAQHGTGILSVDKVILSLLNFLFSEFGHILARKSETN